MVVYATALQATTAAQVQDAARRTFVPSNRTVAVLERPSAGGGKAGAAGDEGTAITPAASPGAIR